MLPASAVLENSCFSTFTCDMVEIHFSARKSLKWTVPGKTKTLWVFLNIPKYSRYHGKLLNIKKISRYR